MERSKIRDHHPYIVMLILIEAAVITIEAQSMIVIPDGAQRQSGIQTEPDWIPGSRANPRAPRNDSFIEGSL